jgi:hypothetical protein
MKTNSIEGAINGALQLVPYMFGPDEEWGETAVPICDEGGDLSLLLKAVCIELLRQLRPELDDIKWRIVMLKEYVGKKEALK